LLLSLEKESWIDEQLGPLLAELKALAYMGEITEAEDASRMFGAPGRPDTILVTDAALTSREFFDQRDMAIDYVRNGGGTLILMGVFSSFARFPDIKEMFEAFKMPWESAAYTNVDFDLNPNMRHIDTSNLTPSFHQKACT
jgi:hypothetical protein